MNLIQIKNVRQKCADFNGAGLREGGGGGGDEAAAPNY
jgi:hypothetical protein